MTNPNILEINDLCVKVAGKELLNNLNLTIPDGEVHALLGQNGSGKTSLMMTITGFSGYEVTQGQIFFKGQDITGLDVCERARLGIAIAQQRPPTIDGVKLRSILAYTLRHEQNPEEKLTELAKTRADGTFSGPQHQRRALRRRNQACRAAAASGDVARVFHDGRTGLGCRYRSADPGFAD